MKITRENMDQVSTVADLLAGATCRAIPPGTHLWVAYPEYLVCEYCKQHVGLQQIEQIIAQRGGMDRPAVKQPVPDGTPERTFSVDTLRNEVKIAGTYRAVVADVPKASSALPPTEVPDKITVEHIDDVQQAISQAHVAAAKARGHLRAWIRYQGQLLDATMARLDNYLDGDIPGEDN